MKLILFLTIFLPGSVNAASLPWLWARAGGGSEGLDYARGAACDANGNCYVTGNFRGDGASLGGETRSSVGGSDAYVIKYRPQGATAWVQTTGGSGVEVGADIDVDESGSALLAGTFSQSISFPGGVAVAAEQGQRDALLYKLDTEGAVLWARAFGGPGNDAANEIATGPNGDVVAIGPFDGERIAFPNGSAFSKTGGDDDVWLGKWRADGSFVWGLTLAGGGHEEGRGVSMDKDGNVIVCGEFDASLDLGGGTLISAGGSDIYVAKYTHDGRFLWVRQFGGSSIDAGRGIDPGPDGSIYVSGEFSGTVSFGPIVLTSRGARDVFLVKLSADGQVLWARSFGSPEDDFGCEIEVDARGNIYCAGSAMPGLELPNGERPTVVGDLDQFIVLFDAGGSVQSSATGGGPNADLNFAIGIDAQGSALVVGSFRDTAAYGPDTIADSGSGDFYVARLDARPGEGTPPGSFLSLTPATLSVHVGASTRFAASIPVSWTVVEPGGGAISGDGVYTAPATPGRYTVLATSSADPSASKAVEVKVVSVSAEESARYAEAAAFSEGVQGTGLLVMKGGAVVFEKYAAPLTPSRPNLLASGTKSFAAALFALGEADGLWTLDEFAADTIGEWRDDPRKSKIRLRHLLSLTSGLLDSPQYSATNVAALDTYDLAINASTTQFAPGEACIYAPSNFQVLAAVFERKTGGQDPLSYLYERLFAKLGFNREHMSLWTRDRNGKPQMAGGAFFTAREWANYGKLFIQNGVWEGEQILPPGTVKLSVVYENWAFRGYGLTWWLNLPTAGTYDPSMDRIPEDGRGPGEQIASNAPADLYMAAGTGKQRLYVIPSEDLVIVRFGNTLRDPAWSDAVLLGKVLGR